MIHIQITNIKLFRIYIYTIMSCPRNQPREIRLCSQKTEKKVYDHYWINIRWREKLQHLVFIREKSANKKITVKKRTKKLKIKKRKKITDRKKTKKGTKKTKNQSPNTKKCKKRCPHGSRCNYETGRCKKIKKITPRRKQPRKKTTKKKTTKKKSSSKKSTHNSY